MGTSLGGSAPGRRPDPALARADVQVLVAGPRAAARGNGSVRSRSPAPSFLRKKQGLRVVIERFKPPSPIRVPI